jgi:peptidoglycan DL-endopeptidase CwlO
VSPNELVVSDVPRDASRSNRYGAGLSGGRRAGVTFALLGVVVASTVVGSTASAAPPPTIAEVQANIKELGEQAEVATEQWLDAKEDLRSVEVRLTAAQDKLTRQRARVAGSRRQMGRLAAETYRRGQLSTLDLVLGDDPESALAQAGYLPSLGQRQVAATNQLTKDEKKLAATEVDIRRQQKKAEAAKQTMSKNKALVQKRLEQSTAQLNRLRADQREKLRRAERSTAVANAARSAGRSGSSGSGGGGSSGGGSSSGGSSGGGGSASCGGTTVQAASAAARRAISFACAQIGDPYSWGAAGPGTWDCSGLTMKAYAAGGIGLPHSSSRQAGYGSRVSLSSALPGDLVFFNSPISHVGIYLGNHLMVHAPRPGTSVRVESLYQTPSAVVRL